jgi:dienelactone hydrolase
MALLFSTLVSGLPLQAQGGSQPMLTETKISFQTEDGWTIYGTLSVPTSLGPGERVPGVVLVHSPAHDQDIYLGRYQVGLNKFATQNLNTALGGKKMITLRIDIRGRGKSAQPQEYHTLSPEQRARVALDVSGAVDFLSHHEKVDAGRMSILSEGASAGPAVAAALRDERVRGLVLLSGRMRQSTIDQIAERDDLPILCLATKEDKTGVVDMAGAYAASRNPDSDLRLYQDLGTGNSMFIMWASKFPNEKPLELTVAEWLDARLRDSEAPREVSFQTSDGWTLSGTLRRPQKRNQPKAPGVILLHSYLTDRHIFDTLEKKLATAGFVVLNFDFRGRGKSQAKGTYFELPQPERDNASLDAKAALDFLAAQEGVDPDQLAVVATSIGTKYGLKAASADQRVKSFVMLGGMPDRADVEKAHFPILFVSSLGLPPIAQAFREFYQQTKNLGSTLVEFEGGSVGYQIFDLDENLQPWIVKWLRPQFGLH